jgi:hypothetical protein
LRRTTDANLIEEGFGIMPATGSNASRCASAG